MKGIINELYEDGILRTDIMMFYLFFMIMNAIYYIGLVIKYKVFGFDDRVTFYHQLPIVGLLIMSLRYPVFAYLSVLHYICHFMTDTIYLVTNENNEYTIHHLYTVTYLMVVIMNCSPEMCIFAIPPLLNNVIYHGSKVYETLDKTKIFRHITFILLRLVYPILAGMTVLFIESLGFGVKLILFLFSVTITLLMIPKLESVDMNAIINLCKRNKD